MQLRTPKNTRQSSTTAHEPSRERQSPLASALRGVDFASGEAMLAPVQPKAAPGAELGDDSGLAQGGGARLPKAVQAKMESSFGADFDHVRVHSDAKVQGMGAKALAQGNNIHLAPGTDLGSSSGQELLGHELAHVQQQSAGRVSVPQAKSGSIVQDQGLEAEADRAGAMAARGEKVQMSGGTSTSKAIQPKLAGSAEVLESRGDKVSKSGRFHKSDWYKVVKHTRAYESEERRIVNYLSNAQGDVAPIMVEEGQKLVAQLDGLDAEMQAWLEDDKHAAILEESDRLHEESQDGKTPTIKGKGRAKAQKEKDNSTVKRGEALRIILPRVRTERDDVMSSVRAANSGRWPQVKGEFAEDLTLYSDQHMTDVVDNQVGGQLNRLDGMKVNGKEGFFAKGNSRTQGNPGVTTGIDKNKSNSSGRSVAMYRLAKLLGIGERIVMTTFATHRRTDDQGKTTTESGVFMEKAKGREIQEEVVDGNVDLSSPLIQVALNQLQFIDALCAQVDRHGGNFFFDPRSGEIKGIDLDLSFGKDVKTLLGGSRKTVGDAESGEGKLKGLPKLVDAKLAQTLLTLDPQLVRDALKGLLEPAEVDSTVLRLQEIKDHLAKPEVRQLGEQDWNSETAMEQLSESRHSYLETVSGAVRGGNEELQRVIARRSGIDRLSEVGMLPFLVQQGKIPQGRIEEFVAEVDELARPRFQTDEYRAIEHWQRKLEMEKIYTEVVKQVARNWAIL
jgi:hypothetical protein